MDAIVAVDNNWAIGYRGNLLLRDHNDIERFKELTMGKYVIMGRKTSESLMKGFLAGRTNIILTSDMSRPNFHSMLKLSAQYYNDTKIVFCKSTNSVFKFLGHELEDGKINDEMDDVYVIGGESIYRQFLYFYKNIYLTHFDYNSVNFDTTFPDLRCEPAFKLTESIQYKDNPHCMYKKYTNVAARYKLTIDGSVIHQALK